jgi:rubredoxin
MWGCARCNVRKNNVFIAVCNQPLQIRRNLFRKLSCRHKNKRPRSLTTFIFRGQILSNKKRTKKTWDSTTLAIGTVKKKRTHTFSAQDLLHHRYTVRGCLPASCACTSENVAAFEGEWNRLGLDEGWSGKTCICEGTKYARVKDMWEWGECGLFVDKVSFSHCVL